MILGPRPANLICHGIEFLEQKALASMPLVRGAEYAKERQVRSESDERPRSRRKEIQGGKEEEENVVGVENRVVIERGRW